MFSDVESVINREFFFDDYEIIFKTESSSFSCEKATMKISGPVNELFCQVVINLKCTERH